MPKDFLFPPTNGFPGRLIELEADTPLALDMLDCIIELNGFVLTLQDVTGYGSITVNGPGILTGELDLELTDEQSVSINLVEGVFRITGSTTAGGGGGTGATPGVVTVANAAARLAMTVSAAKGKTVKQLDDETSWMLVTGGDPAAPADWVQIAAVGGEGVYESAVATNTAWGAIPAGTNLDGKTMQEIVDQATIAYLAPAFTAFGITGYNNGQVLEAGTAFTGSKTFTWATSNAGNVAANSIGIAHLTGGTTAIVSASANDGTETLAAAAPWNAPFTTAGKQFRITGTSSKSQPFTADFNLYAAQPWFYGKTTGARPVIDQVLISSGTKVVADSNGTVLVPYGAMATAPTDWNWFAIPAASTPKTRWYVDALNNGAIGGAVSPAGNLFPAGASLANVSSALWNGVTYLVYVANYQTALANCEMRNS